MRSGPPTSRRMRPRTPRRRSGHTPAKATALDVRDEPACRAVAGAVVAEAGLLDAWINNAGVLVTGRSWEQDEAIRRTMLEINAVGTINGTVAALERMTRAGRGHVINVISLAGIVAAPDEVNYSASKHAAMAFTLGTPSICGGPESAASTSRRSAPPGSGRRCSKTSSTTRRPPAPSPATC